jgi:hypothetical protein
MNFTTEQLKIIYKAVRKFQINDVPLNSKAYQDCDVILNSLFPTVTPQKDS